MPNPAKDETGLYEGLVLGGKYRLEAEIGRGAMGTVWAAMHESLGQRVAVKVISQEHANSEELRRRFDTEARAAAKLRSRFVVGVYDNGLTDHGLPYIVMEYLEGECLEDRIAREGSIHVADVARISRHIARALSKAHARGIVHRDLKPANIFITKSDDEDDGDDWTAKVLDFGIAKMEDFGDRSTTKTGTVLGTPLFMSPEQVRGASGVDSRADLYSMGMVVYNMLTGTYAFEGQSFGDLLVSICTDPLPELSRSAPDAPPALSAWFRKTCARDPNDRYQTADELMRALSDAIGDTSPSTRLSLSDISTTDRMIPLAETYAQSSEIARSGAREIDAGATAHTVISTPERKSRTPLIAGGVALAVGALLALVLLKGSETPKSLGATQTPTAPAADEEVNEPKASDAAKAEPRAEAKSNGAAAAISKESIPSALPKEAGTSTPATTALTGATPSTTKPTSTPPLQAKPRLQTKAHVQTNPKPTGVKAQAAVPTPAPTPKPAALDLGF